MSNMVTLELFFGLGDKQPFDSLDEPLAEEARRIASGLPNGSRMRIAHSLKHHRDAAIRAGDPLFRLDSFLESGLVPSHTAIPIASFDAALEFSVPEGTDPEPLFGMLGGLVDRLGPSVDPSRSAAVFGADHLIFHGDGPVQLFCCLYRAPTLTQEKFSDSWLHQLVEHTTKTPGKTAYRQVHADKDLTARAAQASGVAIDDIDGVALEWYPDAASLWAASDWADQPGAPIVQAETQLIDFSRTGAIVVYTAQAG
jgi:hypothetical protein